MIRERVSTATILLIATMARSLTRLVVRRNAVIKKCDWDMNPEWNQKFYDWLKITSKSYEATEREISNIFEKDWRLLTDEEYKRCRPSHSF